MSEVKHTPGEWKVKIDGTRTGRGPVIFVVDFDPEDDRELAKLETSETWQSLAVQPKAKWKRRIDADEIEANARLMAAAPELLAACHSAINALMLNPDSCQDEINDSIGEIRAAIAKAEGRKVPT